MANTMGPNEGAKDRHSVQPEWREWVYINYYRCNCPFKVIPDYMADEKSYSITNLGVASPSARFAIYLSLLRRR
jgi:hypothetical protein